MKRLIAFDLDGTLAESKQAIDGEMGGLLARLTKIAVVAVMSGGDWPQFRQQLVGNLPAGIDLDRLFLLPASGTKFYRHRHDWEVVYAELFNAEEQARILSALSEAATRSGLLAQPAWGDRIEDRGSQITFSGLGQHAPLEAKQAWDPDFAKRRRLQSMLVPMLPGFAVRVGGSTSVDITREGTDKAYGMRRLASLSAVPTTDMLFIGDAIYPGGNDYPVRQAGIDTIYIRTIDETKRVIEAIILCLGTSDGNQAG